MRKLASVVVASACFALAPTANAEGLVPVHPASGSTVAIGSSVSFRFTGPTGLSEIYGYLADGRDGFSGYAPIWFIESDSEPGTYTSRPVAFNRYATYRWHVEANDFAPVVFPDPPPTFTVGDLPEPPYAGPVFPRAKVQVGNVKPVVKPRVLHIGWSSFIANVGWTASTWGTPKATGGSAANLVRGNSSTPLRFVRLTRLTRCPGRGHVYLGLEYADKGTGTLTRKRYLCSGYIAPKWRSSLASIHPNAVPAGNTYLGDTLELGLRDENQTNVRRQAYRACVRWTSQRQRCYRRVARGGMYDYVRFRVPAEAGSRVVATWFVGRKKVATRSLRVYE